MIRLNKFLSDNGICSRRSADTLISEGKVKINGTIATLGTKIDPKRDVIFVNGKKIENISDEKIYYILNKPAGYITTSSDPHGRKTVMDLVPKYPRVYPVGRLDYSTSGLLILTNDGDLTNKLTHPKFEKEKEYEVEARIMNNELRIKELINEFKKGIRLQEGVAKADKISVLEESENMVKLSIVIHQGWNRQIRRMCEALGLEVLELKRVKVGKLELGNLKEGSWKKVKKEDIL